jgi:quercetin dioxygenase-like cupin family protein
MDAATSRVAQRFVVSHLKGGDFKTDGLREYFQYRELGVAAATDGLAQAHVVRAVPGKKAKPEMHIHEVELQFVYMLKGWATYDFEGQGRIRVEEGSSWIQPSGMKHSIVDYSDDFEALEIVIPADFKTLVAE